MHRLVVTLLLISASAQASSSRRYRKDGPPAPVRIELTLGTEQLDYRNTHFGANPTLGGRSVGHVSVLGRDIGAASPKMFDVSMRFEGITHHVVLGSAIGFLYSPIGGGGYSGASGDPSYTAGASSHVATDNWLDGFYLGATIGTAWTWKSFDMAFTTTMGFRDVVVGLPGFDRVSCKGGTCEAAASSYAFFGQPRLALGIHHASWGMGGYVGAELTTAGSGWAMGGYLELADTLFRRRASAIEPDIETPPSAPPSYP